MELKINSRV